MRAAGSTGTVVADDRTKVEILEELRALEAAASAVPWRVVEGFNSQGDYEESAVVSGGGDESSLFDQDVDVVGFGMEHRDAKLIAAMRNALPMLLERIGRQ